MAYSKKVMNDIFDLYCDNVSIATIAKQYNQKPRQKTIWEWWSKYNWKEMRKKVHKKVDEKVMETAAERAVRHIKILREIQEIGLKKIKGSESKVSAREVNDAIVKERLVCGDSTERIENTGLTVEELRDGCKNYKAARSNKKPNSSKKHTVPSK